MDLVKPFWLKPFWLKAILAQAILAQAILAQAPYARFPAASAVWCAVVGVPAVRPPPPRRVGRRVRARGKKLIPLTMIFYGFHNILNIYDILRIP